MDNEHPSNNLNQDNPIIYVDLINITDEMPVNSDNLDNFLREEFDEDALIDEIFVADDDLINDQEYNLSYIIESQDQEDLSQDMENEDQEYDLLREIERQDQEDSSHEMESQDQEYNTSHEMESPTNDQYLTVSNNCVEVISLDSDDEDTSNEQLEQPTQSSIIGDEDLNSIIYIETSENNSMFPGYNMTIFMELKNLICNKLRNDTLTVSKEYGTTHINDLLKVLLPNVWLNDLIIQQYILLVIQNCKKYKALNLSSFFFNELRNQGIDRFIENLSKRVNLFNKDIILVVLHLDDIHWALILANINERKVYVYDSFVVPFASLKIKLKIFVSFITEVYLKRKLNLNTANETMWEIVLGRSPLQENSTDCGIFVCTNARYHLFDTPNNFKQGDIPLIRQRMTYELIHNTLLSTY